MPKFTPDQRKALDLAIALITESKRHWEAGEGYTSDPNNNPVDNLLDEALAEVGLHLLCGALLGILTRRMTWDDVQEEALWWADQEQP